MRALPVLAALSMPIIAWFSNRGYFGPTNAEISGQFPTLIVPAGYAFAIWGLIFVLDIAWAVQQWWHEGTASRRMRLAASVGFFLSASWMIVFGMQWFWAALAVIWLSLAATLYAAVEAHRSGEQGTALGRWALGMHAGWLSLAVYLNTAQVIVAYEILPTDAMLSWTLVLFAVCGAMVMACLRVLRGSLAYVIPLLWGLIAVQVRQSGWDLEGSDVTARVAVALAAVVGLTAFVLKLIRSTGSGSSPVSG